MVSESQLIGLENETKKLTPVRAHFLAKKLYKINLGKFFFSNTVNILHWGWG